MAIREIPDRIPAARYRLLNRNKLREHLVPSHSGWLRADDLSDDFVKAIYNATR